MKSNYSFNIVYKANKKYIHVYYRCMHLLSMHQRIEFTVLDPFAPSISLTSLCIGQTLSLDEPYLSMGIACSRGDWFPDKRRQVKSSRPIFVIAWIPLIGL